MISRQKWHEAKERIISLARGYFDWFISQWLTWEALTVDWSYVR